MANENLTDANEWLSYAEVDLGVARHLFETYHPRPLTIICFHCQQAAEKAVKALIVLYGNQGGMPKKHDILLLLKQIKNMASIDDKYYNYADMLTPYSVAMRYPNELFLEDYHAEKAISMANEIFDWAKNVIDSNSPTSHNSPTNRN